MSVAAASISIVVALLVGAVAGWKIGHWVANRAYNSLLTDDYKFQEGVGEGLKIADRAIAERGPLFGATEIHRAHNRQVAYLEYEGVSDTGAPARTSHASGATRGTSRWVSSCSW